MKIKTYLLAATILSVSFNAEARESFYNLRNTQPSISVNLSALDNLEADKHTSGTLAGNSSPDVVSHPVIDNTTPKPTPKPAAKPVKVAKAAPAPKPVEPPAPVETAKAEPVKIETPKMVEAKPAPAAAPAPTPAPAPMPVASAPIPSGKPVIDLPPAPPKAVAVVTPPPAPAKSISEIYDSAPPAPSSPPPAPTAVVPQVAPGPKIVVSDDKQSSKAKAKESAKTETRDIPQPAIVPEVAKTPLAPTAETAAIRSSDKVVSLPPISDATKTSPATPAEANLAPQPQLKAPQKDPNLPPPPKLVEAKPAKSVASNNIAHPEDLVDGDSPADEPPAPVKAKKVPAKAEAPKETPKEAPKLIAAASDNSIPAPTKVEAAAAITPAPAPKLASTIVTQTKTVTLTPPAAPTPAPVKTATPPAPVAPETVALPVSNTPAPLPNSASLEKPTPRELPPLSSLYDSKAPTPSTAPGAPTTPTLSATAAPTPAESLPPAATMPSKDAVIVQNQQTSENIAPAASSGNSLTIVYGQTETELPLADKTKLDSIISQLNAAPSARVAVLAYASGTPDQASQAKRTALARALAVRSYLLDRNINQDRMDIKPLGNKTESGVPDRVDIVILKNAHS